MGLTIHVDIVSAEAEVFSGLAEMIIVPALIGDIGILPRHSPLLTLLKAGEVRVTLSGSTQEESFFISGGILEIQPHVVTILSDTALRARDLDEAAALSAKQQAEKTLQERHRDVEYAEAEALLAHALAQLQTIRRQRARAGLTSRPSKELRS